MVRKSGKRYVPERGEVVWLDFDPQTGHERSGRRPALVLSPSIYNRRSGLALLCPITSKVKKYPFEVAIPKGVGVSGVILADQVKNLDWKKRQVAYLCEMPYQVVDDVLEKLLTLLDPNEDEEDGSP